MATTLVHFATNREETVENGKVTGFTKHLHPTSPSWLRFGAAEMRKSGTSFRLAELRVADEQIPGVTAAESAPEVLGSDQVFEALRQRLIEDEADLVLLLHGFACSFEDALSNAAELRTQYGTRARPLHSGVFSWPSNGSLTPFIDYRSDRDDARFSAKAIARAVERLISYLHKLDRKDWCRSDIHLVAHSMGNYALRNALQAMLSTVGDRPLPRIFKNIFLMAPDEDNDAFEDPAKFARLPELAESIQLYFARNDEALVISNRTKGNPDRLGTTGPRTLTSLPQKVVLIDCSDVSETESSSDSRHQYYRKRPEVIADVRQVLAGARPEDIKGREWVPSRNCFRILRRK